MLKKLIRIIGINVLVLLVLFCVVDLGFGVFLIQTPKTEFIRFCSERQLTKKGLISKNTPHRYLGYSPTPGYVKGKNLHNSHGFRGKEIQKTKPDSSFRIFCLGGSTTYSNGVEDYRESYPHQLGLYLEEQDISAEVINAGAGGWSSYETLINFQLRILDLDPDLLVVYHGVNDLHARLIWPSGFYQGDNSGRRAPLVIQHQGWMKTVAKSSNLMRWLLIKTGKMTSPAGLNKIDPYPESLYLYEYKKQYEQGTYPQGIFKEVSVEKMIRSNPPVYFERNLEQLIHLAKANEIDMLLVTFAASNQYPYLLEGSPTYQSGIKEHNGVLSTLAEKHQVSLLEFDQLFPTDQGDFVDAVHLNARGNRKKAHIIGKRIIDLMENKVQSNH